MAYQRSEQNWDRSTIGPELPQVIHHNLIRSILIPSWAIIAGLSLLFIADWPAPLWVQYLPFILSMVFLGLPHGAVDHLVRPRLKQHRLSLIYLGLFLTGYLTLVILYLGFWYAAPALAFAVFILMTWFHWGQGDLYTLLGLMEATYLTSKWQRLLTIVVRGGLPMLVPLLASPATYYQVAESLVSLFQPQAIDQIEFFFTSQFRLYAGAIFATAAGVNAVAGFLKADRPKEQSVWRLDLFEVVLLFIYFWLVPPILAIGVYFCFWHAARHVARLMLIDPPARDALAAGRFRPGFGRFLRDAAPLTIGAILILSGLYWLTPQSPDSLSGSVGLYLTLVAALTLPHIVVVTWMDLKQGVWEACQPLVE